MFCDPHRVGNVRIGIAWRGRMIHEEILDRRIDVRIGQRAGSTIQLSAKQCPDMPESVDFLTLRDSRYFLTLPADPQARFHLRGANERREVQTVDGRRALLVDDLPGGSLQLGELTLLFQFVHADTAPLVTREQIVLRLGLVHDERLISDAVFGDATRVTVGCQKNLDIVLPEDDYQGPPVTFSRSRAGDFALKAHDGQDLRLALAAEPMNAAQLLAKHQAKLQNGVVSCPLPLGARGRVTLGAHTLLFQVVKQSVTVPSPRARPWQERVMSPFLREPVWTTSLLAAFLLVGALVGQALLYQHQKGHFFDHVAPQEASDNHLIEIDIAQKEDPPLPDKRVPDEPQPAEQPAPLQAPQPAETHKAHADAHPERTQPRAPGDVAERNARALDHTVASALRDRSGASIILFQEDPTANARATTGFGGTPESDVGGPGHAGLMIEDSHTAGRSVERIVAKHTDLGPRDPCVIRTKPVDRPDVPITFRPLEGPDDGAGMKDQIAKKIAGRTNAVKGCYEAALRDNPDVSGKIRVNFTVGTAGTVTDVQVIGAQGSLADCIEGKFRAIRGLPILPDAKAFNQTFLLQKD